LVTLVHDWHREGRTVAAVLHDIAFIRRLFPQTLLIARELVAWGPTAEALSDDNIERARRMTDRWARYEEAATNHGERSV
jgi:zinc/manganese transport system ATP-binding protein